MIDDWSFYNDFSPDRDLTSLEVNWDSLFEAQSRDLANSDFLPIASNSDVGGAAEQSAGQSKGGYGAPTAQASAGGENTPEVVGHGATTEAREAAVKVGATPALAPSTPAPPAPPASIRQLPVRQAPGPRAPTPRVAIRQRRSARSHPYSRPADSLGASQSSVSRVDSAASHSIACQAIAGSPTVGDSATVGYNSTNSIDTEFSQLTNHTSGQHQPQAVSCALTSSTAGSLIYDPEASRGPAASQFGTSQAMAGPLAVANSVTTAYNSVDPAVGYSQFPNYPGIQYQSSDVSYPQASTTGPLIYQPEISYCPAASEFGASQAVAGSSTGGNSLMVGHNSTNSDVGFSQFTNYSSPQYQSCDVSYPQASPTGPLIYQPEISYGPAASQFGASQPTASSLAFTAAYNSVDSAVGYSQFSSYLSPQYQPDAISYPQAPAAVGQLIYQPETSRGPVGTEFAPSQAMAGSPTVGNPVTVGQNSTNSVVGSSQFTNYTSEYRPGAGSYHQAYAAAGPSTYQQTNTSPGPGAAGFANESRHPDSANPSFSEASYVVSGAPLTYPGMMHYSGPVAHEPLNLGPPVGLSFDGAPTTASVSDPSGHIHVHSQSIGHVESGQQPNGDRKRAKKDNKRSRKMILPNPYYALSPRYNPKYIRLSEPVEDSACMYVNPFTDTQCWLMTNTTQPVEWLMRFGGRKEKGFFPRHRAEMLRHMAMHREMEASTLRRLNIPESRGLATSWNNGVINEQIIKDRDDADNQVWCEGEQRKSLEELNQQLAASGLLVGV